MIPINKLLIVLIFICLTQINSKIQAQNISDKTAIRNDSNLVNVTPETKNTKTAKADSLINFANKYIGLRYRRGGTTNRGFDCSGFTAMLFAQIKVRLPHSSQGQSLVGVEVNSKNIQKGDLIFFKGRGRRSRRVGHVGMVISEKGEPVKFIHSSVSGGIRIDYLSSDYYRKRFIKVKRVYNFDVEM